jgi:hypothetical protein
VVRIGKSMSHIPEEWQPRHTEARRAWEWGDVDRLCKLCDLEIRTASRKAIGNHPKLKGTEGIHEELRAFARRGIEKAAKRYNPSKGKFQAYAWQDIYRETRRGAEAIVRHEHELHHGRGDTTAVGQDPQALKRQLASALNSEATARWIKRIDDLDRDMLEELRSFLDANRDELLGEIDQTKYWSVRGQILLRRLASTLSQPETQFREISGPQHMMIVERILEAFVDTLRELTLGARAGAIRERAGEA